MKRAVKSSTWMVALVWSTVGFGLTMPGLVQALAPPNDCCSEATPLTVGFNMEGTLVDATADGLDAPPGCGGPNENSAANLFYAPFPGVWYTFSGTGRRVAVSTITAPPKPESVTYKTATLRVSIYKGACGSTTLQCVTRFLAGGDAPPFTFLTKLGVVYRARIQTVFDGNTGSFSLKTADLPESNDNDVCSKATAITVASSEVKDVSYGTSDEFQVVDDCTYGVIDYRTPGVWYKFQGTGAKLSASVFYRGQHAISIYSGTCHKSTDSMATLRCLAGSTPASNVVTFYTEIGTTYYLLVCRTYTNGDNFGLELAAPDPAADVYENDLCPKATPIVLGSSFRGELANAAVQTETVPKCGERAAGLWYSFTGTGGRITAVTGCLGEEEDDEFPNAMIVHVYKGTCVTLQCATSFYYYPCNAAPFTFPTELGIKYYMLVQPDVNNFDSKREFNMTLAPTLTTVNDNDNDVCAKATAVTVGMPLLNNSITLATSDEKDVAIDCDCGNVTNQFSRGLWFSFQGTGGRVWTDVCGGANLSLILNTKVSIYRGTCGRTTLKCVAGSAYPCYITDVEKVTFDTDVGVKYYVLVQNQESFTRKTNFFNLAITNVTSPPQNDVCATAATTSIGSTVAGNLAFASSDEFEVSSVCDGGIDGFYYYPGLWYRFRGSGGSVRVTSACGAANSATNVHIYTGTCGAATLQCVTGHNNLCTSTPLQNVFNFTTEKNATYYMLVRKSPNQLASSTFQVKLDSIPLSPFVPKVNIPVTAEQCFLAVAPAPPKLPPVAIAPKAIAPIIAPKASPPMVTPTPTTPIVAPTVVVTPPMVASPLSSPFGNPVVSPMGASSPGGTPTTTVPPPSAADSPTTGGSPVVTSPAGAPPKAPMTDPVSSPLTAGSPLASAPTTPGGGGGAPTIVAPSPLATGPVLLAPVAAPSVSSPMSAPKPKCRRLGCRIRRLFKAIFGIFT